MSGARIVGIIPARMSSTRLPGKPLAPICGRPMLEHVFRRTAMNTRFAEVCIATCDVEIAEASAAFGCRAIMTSPDHQRGTDRVAEAARSVEADIVVNVQGDEPLIRPEIFDALLAPFEGLAGAGVSATNLMSPLQSDEEHDNLNNVKVVVDKRGRAMYFSREPIPSRRMGSRAPWTYRQIGIYAFRAAVLQEFIGLEPTPSEIAESCDMMRLLEHGYPLQMVSIDVPLQSVDTPADLAAADALMARDGLYRLYAGESRP